MQSGKVVIPAIAEGFASADADTGCGGSQQAPTKRLGMHLRFSYMFRRPLQKVTNLRIAELSLCCGTRPQVPVAGPYTRPIS
jgi:hypothetical protein